MMTARNGIAYRMIGPLERKSAGKPEQTVQQTVAKLVTVIH